MTEPEQIDLLHGGHPHVLSSWLVGDVLVDPGPTSCLPTLLAALDGRELRALALTHIHLDHAGAAGTLARRFPGLEVWVHERGAPHLQDPAKLLASATRLYGSEHMERLWGEVAPVPEAQLRVLHGGERIAGLRVAYTPGHASHHVAYLHEPSGDAFAGDVAGVRIGSGPVLAPTPPPDIDLDAWRASIGTLEGWAPRRLVPTHFGAYDDVDAHLAELREELERTAGRAGELDEAAFAADLIERVRPLADEVDAAAYAHALPGDQSYQGLRRHLERRER
ncbi:MAG TPA: MBL fold metallo-hydrolase [Solirubrobacteraceae bacterium]|nr:MBL fold metallo-hydrolase [Solirubrobacteraceae bacterium]